MPQELWDKVDAYLDGALAPHDAALEAALRQSAAAGLPAKSVTATQGKLLHILARTVSARRILEIGTLGGYSAIWLARALPPGGRLVTLEVSSKHAEVARANIARAGLAAEVEVLVGPALETLPGLEGPFDLAFIDADKANMPRYLEWSLKLVREGGLIVGDNVVQRGAVADAGSADPNVQGLRRFIAMMSADPRLCATAVQTVGAKGHDGLSVALVVPYDGDRRSKVPCLSIGLPVCNGERYLREAIDSLLAQTFGDFELIIADNASTDGTERICRGYAAADHRIRYVRNATNIGQLGNFNLTFALARGRYFKWAADDDVVQPEFVARCLEVLEREPAVVLCHSHTRIIDDHGATVGDYTYPSGHGSGVRPSRRFDDVLAEDRWCFELFGVMRADKLRTTKLLAGHVGSDRGLLAELALRGRFATVSEYLFFSRDHPRRLVRRFPAHHLRAAVENPELAGRRLLPHWRILAEYARGVRRAGLPASERARCYVALARWLGRHGNWARLAVDPVIAVAPSTAPFFMRLAASDRRWLGKRVGDGGG